MKPKLTREEALHLAQKHNLIPPQEDTFAQGLIGAPTGVASMFDIPGELYNLTATGIEKVGKKLGYNPELPRINPNATLAAREITNMIAGEPQTEMGRRGRAGGELLGSFIGPGGTRVKPIEAVKDVGKGITKTTSGLAGFNPSKYETFQKAGIAPTLGEVSNNPVVPMVQKGLEHFPGSAHVFHKKIATREEKLDQLFNKVADIESSLKISQTGKLTEKGAQAYNAKATEVAGKLYDRAKKGLDPNSPVPLPKTSKAIEEAFMDMSPEAMEILAKSKGGPEILKLYERINAPVSKSAELGSYYTPKSARSMSNQSYTPLAKNEPPIPEPPFEHKNLYLPPKNIKSYPSNASEAQNIINMTEPTSPLNVTQSKFSGQELRYTDRQPGTIPFHELKYVNKKELDDLVDVFGKVGTGEEGRIKKVVGALREDMKNHVLEVNPKAARDYAQADKMWKQYSDRPRQIANKAATETDPIKIFNDNLSRLKKGDTEPTKIIMQRLDPADKKLYSSTAMNELGSGTNGAFDPNKFGKEFNKLRPESQDMLLSGFPKADANKIKEVAKALDHARIASSVANTSKTAYYTALGAWATNLWYNPLTSLAAAGGARITSEVFTNPVVLDALYKASKTKTVDGVNKVMRKHLPGIISEISRMEAINQQENEKPKLTKEQAEKLLMQMEQSR